MALYTYGTSPAHFVEVPDPITAGQTIRPPSGTVVIVQDAVTLTTPAQLLDSGGSALSQLTTSAYGYLRFSSSAPIVRVSADAGVSWWVLVGAEAIADAVAGGAGYDDAGHLPWLAMPAGAGGVIGYSLGAYGTRPSTRTDLRFLWIGPTQPTTANGFTTGDIWLSTTGVSSGGGGTTPTTTALTLPFTLGPNTLPSA